MTLRMRVLPRFPAKITATNGLTVERPNGTPNLIVKPSFGDLVQIPNVGDGDNVFFMAWDKVLGLYRIMSFNDLFAGVASLGFMEESVYDPQNKHADAFDRANHTGAQAISTVTGLQTALNALTAADATKLALAGGVMTGAIQDLVFAPSSAPTKKAGFDLSQITAGQQRKIWVPDNDVSLSRWEFIKEYAPAAVSSLIVPNLSAFKRLRLRGYLTLSAATTLAMQWSADNGSTFDTASSYIYMVFNATSAPATAPVNAIGTGLPVSAANSVGGVASAPIEFRIEVDNFNNSGAYTMALMQMYGSTATTVVISSGGYQHTNTNAFNALRILPASGTITGSLIVEGERG
ncbi:hypothetical protein [Rhizobium sp. S163]|uniref:hypothetical protein n=1 Tax=Rhizobium sp. S163 TaxID=3055039 RepID=UPI0025A9D22F|nr:hypothetical protein [Rhizobium sp. S163]MDM9643888.1 hypothetical protein [Rhizobium sp. S163]